MAYDYEQLYRSTPQALGAPTPAIVAFFEALPAGRLHVLDIGCGQGRDALFLGRAGHSVLGVDLSPSGIRDLSNAACAEGLDVTGVVADVTEYEPDGLFDVVLIDRTLHMLEPAPRLGTLDRLLVHVAAGGWCLIEDERRNIADFRRVADNRKEGWSVAKEKGGHLLLRKPPARTGQDDQAR